MAVGNTVEQRKTGNLGRDGVGRDGSPSRPFAERDPLVLRDNGGFGEPALPMAGVGG